jgi:tRNA threonylcarbamoyladenosine biosynthesis protein TsaB
MNQSSQRTTSGPGPHPPASIMLAMDTSTRTVGLAIYDGVHVLGELIWTSLDYHTVELAPAVSEMLARAKIKTSELGAVAVALGPGSFTGLRIGLALAKGLALAQNLPLIGIPTLDFLAAAQPLGAAQPLEPVLLVAVLQAGRGRLAVGWYQVVEGRWTRCSAGAGSLLPTSTSPTEVLTPQELSDRIQAPTMICGELTEDERRLLGRKRKNVILASPASSLRRPSYLAELAWQRWQTGQVDDPATLSPIYLHYNNPIPG